MNTVLKTIEDRYSCRAFTDKVPSDADLHSIANAAVCSPSGLNRQAWRVIVLKDKTLMREMEDESMLALSRLEDKSAYERMMKRGGKLFYNAQCMLMLPLDAAAGDAGQLDCGILCQSAALSATSLGIDNLICGLARFAFAGDKGDYFKEKLNFPAGYEFGISILLGYAEQKGTAHTPDFSKISFI